MVDWNGLFKWSMSH
jgi:hsp70-interacting protein